MDVCYIHPRFDMKLLKRNIFFIIASVAFALFAGLNVCAFTEVLSSNESQILEVPVGIHSLECDLPVAVNLESSNSVQALLSRSQRSCLLDGLDGRGFAPTIAANRAAKVLCTYAVVGMHRGMAPTALAVNHPKDYYVYTLERILC